MGTCGNIILKQRFVLDTFRETTDVTSAHQFNDHKVANIVRRLLPLSNPFPVDETVREAGNRLTLIVGFIWCTRRHGLQK